MMSERNRKTRAVIRRHNPVALARLVLSDQAVDAAERAAALVTTDSDDWGEACTWLEMAVGARREAEDLVVRAVVFERQRGTTWEQIGDHLGITRQSAQARYGQAVTEWDDGLHAPYGAEDTGQLPRRPDLPDAACNPQKAGARLDTWSRTWNQGFETRLKDLERPVTGKLRALELRDEVGMVIAEARWSTGRPLRAQDPGEEYLAEYEDWKASVYERIAATEGNNQDAADIAAGCRARAAERRARIAAAATGPQAVRDQLLSRAQDVLEVPEETAAGYLPRLLMRLAWVRQRDLTHAAVLTALDEVTGGREQEGTDSVPYDTGLVDQAQDVTQVVPASIASRTLYTLLLRIREAAAEQLTHQWIAEQTAAAVRNYRASDAVKAQRTGQAS